jgi:hypothetical protein
VTFPYGSRENRLSSLPILGVGVVAYALGAPILGATRLPIAGFAFAIAAIALAGGLLALLYGEFSPRAGANGVRA